MGLICGGMAALFIIWALLRAGGEKRIVARYAGTCRTCERNFKPGVEIFWRKGEQPRHTDCDAANTLLEAETTRDVLERLDSLKTAAARRKAVRVALEVLKNPEARTRLLLRASALETEATLEKVAGLKTSQARRRRLTEALDALREDEIADDLQATQIAALEAALRAEEAPPSPPAPQRAT